MINQKDYWNSVAEKKEFSVPLNKDIFKKYVTKNAMILDFGCGYGRILYELSEIGYKNLVGFDFSKGMIEKGNRLFPKIKMKTIKDHNELPKSYYDVIILFAVLTCIENNEEQKRLILNIYRSLKSNGMIYINDFLLNNDVRNIERYNQYKSKFSNFGTFELNDGGVVRHHKKEWIAELLKDFIQIEYNETQFKTMNGNVSNAFYYFGNRDVV